MSDATTAPPEAADHPEDQHRGANNQADEKDAKQESHHLSPRVKHILLLVVALLIVAGLAWFVYHELHGRYMQSTNDAVIRADSGTISPKTTGYVVEVLVTDNQDVAAGQLLARIDPSDYQAKLDEAQAEIASSEASAEGARASLHEQYASIEQTRAQLAQTKTKALHDEQQVRRYVDLVQSGAETAEKLADLQATADGSRHEVQAQMATLEGQQRHLGTLEAQIRQSEAQIQSNRAKLAATRVDLQFTELRAPFAGRVGDKSVTVGQYAQPGTKLMSIVPLQALYIVANFKETQIGLMRAGQVATIKVDALDGVDFHGHVDSVSPGTGAQFSLLPPENATGNFTKIVQRVPVRIALEAGDEARKLLVPGLSVDVTVNTSSAKDSRDQVKDEQQRLTQASLQP